MEPCGGLYLRPAIIAPEWDALGETAAASLGVSQRVPTVLLAFVSALCISSGKALSLVWFRFCCCSFYCYSCLLATAGAVLLVLLLLLLLLLLMLLLLLVLRLLLLHMLTAPAVAANAPPAAAAAAHSAAPAAAAAAAAAAVAWSLVGIAFGCLWFAFGLALTLAWAFCIEVADVLALSLVALVSALLQCNSFFHFGPCSLLARQVHDRVGCVLSLIHI